MSRSKAEQPKRLAGKLKQIRLALGLTQEQMLHALEKESKENVKFHSGYFTRYESGSRIPSLLILLAYTRVSKIPLESLIDDDVDLPK